MATRLAALWLRAAAHRETLREARLAQREMLLWGSRASRRHDSGMERGANRRGSGRNSR